MKAFTLSALSTLFAGLTSALPLNLAKRTGSFAEIDITILQFALTVSTHLPLPSAATTAGSNFGTARTS